MKRLKTSLAALMKIRNIAPLSVRKTIFEGIFNSVLTYCISLWGGLNKKELDDLQVMQNKALRFVLNKPPRSSRSEMFDESGFMTVRQLIVYHTTLNVYKIKQCKEPEYLFSNIERENIHENIIIEKTRLTLTRNGFIFRGAETCNDIPHEIRKIKKIADFKKKMKQWIHNNINRF